ncbi:MAG: hypothetical protein AAFQ44_09115, partial [Pseudomonadota bacterium]
DDRLVHKQTTDRRTAFGNPCKRALGNAIDRDMFESIWNDSVELLKIGVKRNAIITVDGAAPSHLRYGERTNIFNKQTCPCCSGAVTRTEIAGRRAFLCETCQPLL